MHASSAIVGSDGTAGRGRNRARYRQSAEEEPAARRCTLEITAAGHTVRTMPPEDETSGVELPVVWLGPEEIPILHVNAMVSQLDPQTLDSLILTIGQVTFPAIVGTSEEERQQQLEQVAYVPI